MRSGWAHGDFWTANLLVAGDRLTGVLDWDGATADGLPLSDLLHLLAHADRESRRLPHGRRCLERLWPLARRGDDPALLAYCEATELPPDALEPLAVAYWLERVARDLRTFADRAGRLAWIDVNVLRPLAALDSW